MEIGEWNLNWQNIKRAVQHPSRVVDEILLYFLIRSPLTFINAIRPFGTNIFDREWDVVIILDTCRVDALKQLQDEYDFIKIVDSVWSVGGNSPEWIARTFDSRHTDVLKNTAYLSANPHAQRILEDKIQYENDNHFNFRLLRNFPSVDKEDLGKLEYIFKYEPMGESGQYGHRSGGTPPRYVTDRAIDVGRNEEYERLVLHYFQPHSPWVANANADNSELRPHEEGFGYITETGDSDSAWEAYLDDLRWVLDDIEILINNIDADKIVITADHGDAFGEYNVLSHKIGAIHPKIRKVPWMVTSGKDTNTHTTSIEEPDDTAVNKEQIDNQLSALGYKT
jgi:hypothetical protein